MQFNFVKPCLLAAIFYWNIIVVQSVQNLELGADTTDLKTLQLVQILYRHGDRTPTRSYPTDPYNNVPQYWPQGVGQLTDIGKIQHYNLGKYFRKRYDGFLSRKYYPHETYVLASDMDRTIMSAEVNLAGLYEPIDSDTNWNPTIPWTPVPVRTIPENEDKLLRTSKVCLKYQRLYDELMESDFVKNMNKENQDFIHYVSRHSGVPGNRLRDIVGIEDVLQVDVWIDARFHNYTLPPWAESIMGKFHELAAQHYALATFSTEMKRLKGGPLWKVFLKNMKKIVSKSWNLKPKLYVYSAHDSTLMRLMNTLGVFNGIMPTYASAFIVELHKDENCSDCEHFVRFYYRNESYSAPYQIEIPGCSIPCSLNKLMELTAPVVPKNWEKECEDLVPLQAKVPKHFVLTQAFIIVGSLFITISVLLFISRKKINFELFQYRMPLPGRIRPHPPRYTGYAAI